MRLPCHDARRCAEIHGVLYANYNSMELRLTKAEKSEIGKKKSPTRSGLRTSSSFLHKIKIWRPHCHQKYMYDGSFLHRYALTVNSTPLSKLYSSCTNGYPFTRHPQTICVMSAIMKMIIPLQPL